MARVGKFRNNVVISGTNDGTKQVSKNAWNDDKDVAGMFGHTATTLTVAIGAITPINDMHKVDGEGASADFLTNITNTETAEFDELWLLEGAQAITVQNSGNMVTLTGLDKRLSTTVPTKFIRVGTTWYEVGASGGGVFPDTSFAVQDDGDTTKQMLVQLSGATTAFDTTLTFVQTANRAVTFPDATTTLAGLSVAQSWTAKQTFQDDSIDISNPADTFQYTIQAGAIAADRILNLPVITGADTIAVLGLAQSWGDVIQTFKDNSIKINSPDDADGVTFVNSDQTADRNLTIPILTANDTLVTIGLANAWGTANQNISATGKWQEGGTNISPIGVQDVPVPITAFYTPVTEPATGLTDTEFGAASHKITLKTMDFTSTIADERAQARTPFPRQYDNLTVDIQINWSFASGTGVVRWGFRAVATGDNEAIATNFGTAGTVDDTAGIADQVQQATISSVTIGNTPADTNELHLELFREGSHVNDTFSGTARIHSIVIRPTTDAAVSA